jgi:hypothetical protein
MKTNVLAETAAAQMRSLNITTKTAKENAQAMFLAGALAFAKASGAEAAHTHSQVAMLAACGRFDEACAVLHNCAAVAA